MGVGWRGGDEDHDSTHEATCRLSNPGLQGTSLRVVLMTRTVSSFILTEITSSMIGVREMKVALLLTSRCTGTTCQLKRRR